REGLRMLTPEYAAPEQIAGGDITTAADVYAIGVLLYVLLAGRHPAGPAVRSPAALLEAIAQVVPPRPPAAARVATRAGEGGARGRPPPGPRAAPRARGLRDHRRPRPKEGPPGALRLGGPPPRRPPPRAQPRPHRARPRPPALPRHQVRPPPLPAGGPG